MSKNRLKFTIATPERVLHQDEIDQLSCPTMLGEVTILPNHLPLVSVIAPGELKLVDGAETRYISIGGGFLEVRLGNEVVVLADAAEYGEEIDLERAEQARERARKLMSEKIADAEEFATAQAALERSLARIKVARRKKYRDVGKSTN